VPAIRPIANRACRPGPQAARCAQELGGAEELAGSLRGAGVDFALADLRGPVVAMLERSGLHAALGADYVYTTLDEAVHRHAL
jgi:hypothetical protein